jgi:predicted aspartyl protease
MGEIRVEATLTNAVEESLAASEKTSGLPVRSVRANAVVDTGAVRSVLPARVAEQLGVRRFTEDLVRYADGHVETVPVVGPIVFSILDRQTTDDAYVLGDEILIGQTVLEKLDLLADCRNCRLVPNPDHPDGPVLRV